VTAEFDTPVSVKKAREALIAAPGVIDVYKRQTEGGAMDDAITVPLIAVSERMFRFLSKTPRALHRALGVGGEERFAGDYSYTVPRLRH